MLMRFFDRHGDLIYDLGMMCFGGAVIVGVLWLAGVI
jgi:hypothetical protein